MSAIQSSRHRSTERERCGDRSLRWNHRIESRSIGTPGDPARRERSSRSRSRPDLMAGRSSNWCTPDGSDGPTARRSRWDIKKAGPRSYRLTWTKRTVVSDYYSVREMSAVDVRAVASLHSKYDRTLVTCERRLDAARVAVIVQKDGDVRET